MTKQRRSFFVDDILHMVMPMNKNTHDNGDLKRKRSSSSEDGNKNEEEISKKKFRIHDDDEEDHNDESNYSQAVDIIGDNDEESCTSDTSNNIDNHSGKLRPFSQVFCIEK
jgi:hypothetical protein